MDWYLSADDPGAVRALRHEVAAYLGRHSEPDADIAAAELVMQEMVTNAVRHAAGPVWVSLEWREVSPTITVLDLGPGFDPARLAEAAAPEAPGGPDDPVDPALFAEGGRGLFLVNHLSSAFAAHARRERGMSVSATLPVKKAPAVSHDMPRRATGSLPDLSETEPGTPFGKESFLRALVVQLARTMEYQHGPDAADAAVAQVGTDVGGQMEAEYRLAHRVVGRMSPGQVADSYVRLKHAIDGGFYVIEVSSDRIVLGNTRCPFGDAVALAPSLCRMTSSVFGGIAARNNPEGASVLLEERIAVGDPGCRVVVYLAEPPASVQSHVHRYAATD